MPCIECKIRMTPGWLDQPSDEYPTMTNYEAMVYRIENQLPPYDQMTQEQRDFELAGINDTYARRWKIYDPISIINWDAYGPAENGDPGLMRGMYGLYYAPDGTWTGQTWRLPPADKYHVLIVNGIDVDTTIKIKSVDYSVRELADAWIDLHDPSGTGILERKVLEQRVFNFEDIFLDISWTDGVGYMADPRDLSKKIKKKDINA